MSGPDWMRSDETVLFEGDVKWLTRSPNYLAAAAVITNQRVILSSCKQQHEKFHIVSVTEGCVGAQKNMVFKLRSGGQFALMAENEGALKMAGMILTGEADHCLEPAGRNAFGARHAVSWLAAWGPLLSASLLAWPAMAVWGSPLQWGLLDLFYGSLAHLALVWFLLVASLMFGLPLGIGVLCGHKAQTATWCVSMCGLTLLQCILAVLIYRH